MNAKRKKKHFSVSELVLLGIAAVILTSGGVMHAYAKNKEIEIARKVDEAQKEIDEHFEAVAMVDVKIERRLDRYLLKESLSVENSMLRETHPMQFEMVNPGADGEEQAQADLQ